MSMGGGGGGGGSVVQFTNPLAAMYAGQMGSNAAQDASNAFLSSTQDAIASINRQYSQAAYNLQPYRTTGVQALDQLNQYLGLDPYNPGSAPTAPKAPSINDITQSQIRAYINQNTTLHSGELGSEDGVRSYFGVGADLPGGGTGYGGKDGTTPNGTWSFGGAFGSPAGPMGRGEIQEAVRNQLFQDYLPGATKMYEADLENYKRNLNEYNQNKAWYDRYSAEGPLTAQQISDRITNLPGYQAQLQQGVDALGAAASSKGYLGSGRQLKELNQYGQNTLSQFYGDELSRLAGLVTQGQQSAAQTSQLNANQGNSLAQLYSDLGSNQGNSYLAGANALSQGLIAANQNYKVVGGSDGGGMGGIGSILGGIGSILGAL